MFRQGIRIFSGSFAVPSSSSSILTTGARRCCYVTTSCFRQSHQKKILQNWRNTNKRQSSNKASGQDEQNMKIAYYGATVAVFVLGITYASVPLYKVFCQMTGFGGTTQVASEEKVRQITPVEGAKIIKIYFASNVHDAMPWKFKPTQRAVKIVPGETALAFYTVKNPSDKAITGIATYNVHPPKAGLYFNKIQCFCFEEQRLNPHEEIDMPVFFFVDPEFVNDPAMDNVNHITLSYTFFKTGEEDAEPSSSSNSSIPSSSTNNSSAASKVLSEEGPSKR